MDDLDHYERYLHQQLSKMRERHQLEMKPIIDRLTEIASMRPAPRLVISAEQAQALGIFNPWPAGAQPQTDPPAG